MKRLCMTLATLAAFSWWTGAAPAQVTFFVNNQAGFNAAVAGRPLIGVETFAESTVAAGSVINVNDPLTQGVANNTFPTGLAQPLTIQSNQNGANPATTNPRGAGGLASVGTNDVGPGSPPSNVVVSNNNVDATDYLFTITPVSAVGFNSVSFLGGATMVITVFNTANVQIGQATVPADGLETNHIGLLTNPGIAIGRINMFDPGNGFEGADNLELHALPAAVPEPATLAVLGMAVVGGGALYRRRRRRVIEICDEE